MAVRVLIVDDSGFFRRRLADMIGQYPGLEVVGSAGNGREAIEKVRELGPDVITMDYEMPVMDGISAVKAIMRERPTPILMFSSLTYEGARVTLDSLEAGAVDYLPKSFDEIARSSEELRRTLGERLLAIARSGQRRVQPRSAAVPAAPPPARPAPRRRYRLLVLGTSTGGPVALQTVLTALPAGFPIPILLVQHMPASFTPAFAERLDKLCRIRVAEARDGDSLRPGQALLAPGGRQLLVGKGGRLQVMDGDERLNYKPCVDLTFGSAARQIGADVLAVVLTGMGADGCEGARMLKQAGASVWTQDEASCVIYGMPQAVVRAGLSDETLPLSDIGPRLAELASVPG